MSKVQRLLRAIAEDIDNKNLYSCELYRIAQAMDGVSDYAHLDIALAAFGEYEKDGEVKGIVE